MILYFENKRGQRRVISNPPTVKDMWKDIDYFLKEHNYISPYSRIDFGEKEWVIDVGSHSEFFIVKDFNDEDYNDVFKGDGE